ncbi:uncharacterized protein [Macaca fascicularis]|uniref:uncharacterized protein n=1 Tax=Macaca fascicularis TaxID=9541 RepID=UPI003D1554DF
MLCVLLISVYTEGLGFAFRHTAGLELRHRQAARSPPLAARGAAPGARHWVRSGGGRSVLRLWQPCAPPEPRPPPLPQAPRPLRKSGLFESRPPILLTSPGLPTSRSLSVFPEPLGLPARPRNPRPPRAPASPCPSAAQTGTGGAGGAGLRCIRPGTGWAAPLCPSALRAAAQPTTAAPKKPAQPPARAPRPAPRAPHSLGSRLGAVRLRQTTTGRRRATATALPPTPHAAGAQRSRPGGGGCGGAGSRPRGRAASARARARARQPAEARALPRQRTPGPVSVRSFRLSRGLGMRAAARACPARCQAPLRSWHTISICPVNERSFG